MRFKAWLKRVSEIMKEFIAIHNLHTSTATYARSADMAYRCVIGNNVDVIFWSHEETKLSSTMICVDVAALFGVGNFIKINKNATLFNVAKFVVNGSSKHSHSGRQAHIGVD